MYSMDDLIKRLSKAIDHAEQMARYSGGTGNWSVGARIDAEDGRTAEWEIAEGSYVHSRVRGNTRANHVALHDPASVLRMVAAHRKILDEHAMIWRDIGWLEGGDESIAELEVCARCVPRHSGFNSRADVPVGPCATVAALAQGYGVEA